MAITTWKDEQLAEIRQRIRDGAEWLDQHRPGWHSQLDMVEFDMNDLDCCILGQLYPKWDGPGVPTEVGKMKLADLDKLGFWVLPGTWEYGSPTYAQLTVEWRQLILDRLGV